MCLPDLLWFYRFLLIASGMDFDTLKKHKKDALKVMVHKLPDASQEPGCVNVTYWIY
jgi:hypothetical protein